MTIPRTICIALLAAINSCADKGADSGARHDGAPASFSERLNQKQGYTQDQQGNWIPQTDKRSSFEREGDSPYFSGSYEGKSIESKPIDKKSWWGSKPLPHKTFKDPTSSSRFSGPSTFDGRQASGFDGNSPLTGEAFSTNRYDTGVANENNSARLPKQSDAETDVRRRVYPQPDIIDYEQQRRLSLEQSKSLLGR